MRIGSLDAFPARRPMFGEGNSLLRRRQGADMRDQVRKLLGELGFALDPPCKLESGTPPATPTGPTPKPKASLRRKKTARSRFAVIDEEDE